MQRHDVKTLPHLLSLRLDESMFFANSTFLEETILNMIQNRAEIEHIIIQCNSISEIDFSALEMLKSLNRQLLDKGIKLSLSEIKGPVMDQLKASDFMTHLSGKVYLSHYQAFGALS
ncbi:sodium-independent anion transporter [Marinomonas sp. 5E14-1]|uniref:sodium-independent anion transporter n=1 Tax=Marinomonas sp. 5E14-1 TaxID=3153922 RepID=UPI003265F42B